MSNFSNIEISHYKVKSLPTNPEKNSVYYILDLNTNKVKGYITDKNGIAIPLFGEATGGGGGSVNSVTGTGVTGTSADPKVNIATFVSSQLGNLVKLSTLDGKLVVNPITSPNASIDVVATPTELQIQLAATIQAQIETALQPGDNVSELFNDAGYITSIELENQLGSLLREDFEYTGSQTFTTMNNYAQVYGVFVTGVGALHPSQYTLTPSSQITINDALEPGDFIVVIYSQDSFGSLVYYTQAQIDVLLQDKEDRANKQNSLAVDGTGTKYITVDAVNQALADLADIILTGDIPDATTTIKGKVKLAGDLSGTADLPTVPGLALKQDLSEKVSTIIGNETDEDLYPNTKAVADADTAVLNDANTYADSLALGLLDDRGNYDASSNLFPSTGGSGIAGAVLTGDVWYISVAGTLGGTPVNVGDSIRALTDTPGQTSSNWGIIKGTGLGFIPENVANKTTFIAGAPTSNTLYPSVKAMYDWTINYMIALFSFKATLVNADTFAITDSEDGNKAKRISWLNIRAILNTLYAPTNSPTFTGNVVVPTADAPNEAVNKAQLDAAVQLVAERTFYISTTGSNALGVLGDMSKPYATIDYVLALPIFQAGDKIELITINGVFPMNTTFPLLQWTIKSQYACTLDFSANSNTNITTASTHLCSIELPFGIIKNERAGGTGCIFANSNTLIIAKELYWNTSSPMLLGGSNYKFSVGKVTIKSYLINSVNFIQNEIDLDEVVCLSIASIHIGHGGVGDNLSLMPTLRINKITGAGAYDFVGKIVVGDIYTTGTSGGLVGYANRKYIHITFVDSVITSAGGIELGSYYSGDGIFTGSIRSCPKINYFGNEYEPNTGHFLNFSANLGAGIIRSYGANVILENCTIKSNSSPLGFFEGVPTTNTKITIKNSTFELVTPAPLVTGGSGQLRNVVYQGISYNATKIAEFDGLGVTVTSLDNDIVQISITTASNITTDTLDSNGRYQHGKTVILNNTAPINLTVDGGVTAMYMKKTANAVTFVQGVGRTLVLVDGTAVFNGAIGSTAVLTSDGLFDYLRISNA